MNSDKEKKKLIFYYKGYKHEKSIEDNDSLREILKKFMNENKIEKRDHYFISNGKKISLKSLKEKPMKAIEFSGKKIFVFNLNTIKDKNDWKLENILCPECQNLAFIIYNNETITLDCKACNKKSNYSLNEFMDLQFEISNFICDDCKSINNFYDTRNKSYICYNCDKKLCDGCHFKHKYNSHNVIEYRYKYDYCVKHSNIFESYCNTCNCNICREEEKTIHQNHSIIIIKEKSQKYKEKEYDKVKNKNNIRNEFIKNIKNLRNNIGKYKKDLQRLKDIFDRMMINMLKSLDNHIKLNEYIYNSLESLNNYNKVKNIDGFLYKKFLKDIINFTNLEIKNKFLYVIEKFYSKNIPYNQIELSYTPKSNKIIQFFNDTFAELNKGNCFLIIKDKFYELDTKYEYKKKTTSENFKINLIANRPIIDMKNMFSDCDSLKAFVSYNFDTSKVRNMSNMFNKCLSLISVKGIKDTSNVTNMSGMFQDCGRLTSISNISNWDLSKVKDISFMFSKCAKLENLSEYLIWDTSNIINMNNLFNGCSKLLKLPDISSWNISNVTDMNHMFSKCGALKSFPDISKWKTSKVANMSYMFQECFYLEELPDISQWDTSKVEDMSGLLYQCQSLKELSDISNWDTSNVISMNSMFYYCIALVELPNISNWNVSKVKDIRSMFEQCQKNLRNVPDRSMFNSKIKDLKYYNPNPTNENPRESIVSTSSNLIGRKSTLLGTSISNPKIEKEECLSDNYIKHVGTGRESELLPSSKYKINK